jgi:hypothetical protein
MRSATAGNAPARRRALVALVIAASGALAGGNALAEAPRRICASLEAHYYVFDSEFFDIGDGFGGGAALRCEIASDFYFESVIGFLDGDAGGADIDGFDYRLNLFAIIPYFIPVPYRPVARLGVGFISVNPVTATPTDTYRPTQTTMYLLAGAGITRTVLKRMLVEVSADVLFTPYEYRIYEFDRQDVSTSMARFTHLSTTLAVTYTF